MELRNYQIKIIEDTRKQLLIGNKHICIVAPCGSGKSVVLSTIIKTTTKRNNRVLFLVHRKELLEQISDTMSALGVDMTNCDCYMVQTATRRLNRLETPDIIVVDEVHHILSKSYMRIIENFSNSIVLGFTATPIRMNEGGLGKVFNALVRTVSTKWLIDNNYLADYRYFAPSLVSVDGLKVKRGEYDIEQIRGLVEQSKVYGETVDNWVKIANGKKTIIYCASIVASQSTVEAFSSHGINAVHLDGKASKESRHEVVRKFRDGEITVLSNVDLFGEGFDVPDCECVVLLRPTKSLSLFIQQSMRSMRYKEGKTAIIIDHVNNIIEHGLPDDDREWTLDVKKKNKSKGEAPIRICDNCKAVLPLNVSMCEYCGYVFEKNDVGKAVVDDDLKELDKEAFRKARMEKLKSANYADYMNIKTFSGMCEFQKAKKYKFGWTIRKCAELGIYIPTKYSYMAMRFYGIDIHDINKNASNNSIDRFIESVDSDLVTIIDR